MKTFTVLALMALLLAACQPGTCNNNISGSSNVGNCGGTGDDQDVNTTTPAPVFAPVFAPPPPPPAEPAA